MSNETRNARRAKILVVDDTTANLQLLTNLLTEHGYAVFPASDGELALEFVRSILPDLILLDIRMPEMDGYEVCRRLKADERTRSIPTIFISILEDEREKVKGFQAGGVDYITKPFQPEEVLARVRTHLSLRELAGNLEQKVSERTEELMIANQRLQREIAERKRAEEALRESEAKYMDLYENAPDMYASVNARTALIEQCNSTLSSTLGYSKEEIIGRPVFEIYHPDCLEEVQKAFKLFRDRGEVRDKELQLRRKDGSRLDVSLNVSSVRDEEGNILYSRSTLRDISERKQAEEERLKSSRFLAGMDRVNRAIQGTNDLEQMMSDVLDVVLSIFDCDRAFLAYPLDPEAESWTSPMERTTPEYSGVLALGLVMPMDKEVAETFRILLNSDGPVKFGPGTGQPLPAEVSERFRFKSFMSTALYPRVGKPWQFGIHQCSYPRVWTQEEERLLQEIGRRLEDSLTSLLAHRNLRESEARYRRIVDTASEGIWVVGPDAMTTFVNSRMAAMLGCSGEEMIGRPLTDFMFEEDASDHLQKIENCRQGTSECYERRFRRQDGQTVWTHVSATPIFDDAHDFNGFFAMFTDITERKRTEEALKLSQVMIDGASMGIFRGSEDARILFVNDYWARKLGYTPEELCSMTFFDLDPSLTSESWRAHRKKMAVTGSNAFESVHRCKDGTDIPVEITVNLFHYRDQVYSCSFARDISDRMQAEKTMREAQLVLENSPAVVFHWGPFDDWPVEMVSGNVAQFGYTPEELLFGAVPYAALVHPEDLDQLVAEVHAQIGRGEDTFNQEYRIVTKQGEVRWVDERSLIKRDVKGRVTGYQGIVMDVTDRKQAEQALRESEELFRYTTENIPAPVFITDDEGKFTFICANTEFVLGYTVKELHAMGNVSKLFGKELFTLDALETQGELHNIESDIVKKDGKIHVFLTTVKRVSIRGGTILYVCHDITDRKQAEEALRESERKYRAIVEHAPFGITRSTRDGKLLSVNPALASILKYDSAQELQETINRSSIQDVLFPKPSQREPLVKNILATDAWHVFNNRLRCKDGSVVTCRVHSRRILDADGQTSAFESYQENITDQLEAEQALRESEEKFRVLAETSPVAICIYQGEHVTYANPAMERLFGYRAEELCRMHFWDWAHDDSKELIRQRGLARQAGENVPGQYEARYITKDGEEKVVLISAGAIEYQAGAVGVASFLDITERKRTEELIRASLEEKDVLLREIHHRVKNNLQVVSSLLYLQAQKLTDPELQSHFLESQSRICSMALAHEQLYQSKSLAEVSVKAYVESLVGQLRQIFQRPGQQIECRMVIGDIVLDIEKVIPCGLLITELLSNAYKHAFVDGRKGHITVSMKCVDKEIVLAVADDGVGLPAEFDYRQAKTLGLQLVTALVNQLNGTLDLDRSNGTLFRVRFVG